MFLHALLMFSNPLKMIEIGRNMSELWQIVFKNVILSTREFVGFITWTPWLGVASGLQVRNLFLVKSYRAWKLIKNCLVNSS